MRSAADPPENRPERLGKLRYPTEEPAGPTQAVVGIQKLVSKQGALPVPGGHGAPVVLE